MSAKVRIPLLWGLLVLTAPAALSIAQEHAPMPDARACQTLYRAHLTAAKGALSQGDRRQAVAHLQAAEKTLARCAKRGEPRQQKDLEMSDALAHW